MNTMILYDYKCTKCNVEFEKFTQSIETRNDLVECPECLQTSGKHVVTSVNFQLNGLDPSFPGAYDKWTRTHEKAGKVGKVKELEESNDNSATMY